MEHEYENGNSTGDRNASGTNTDTREPVVVAEQPACPVEEVPQNQGETEGEAGSAYSGTPTSSSEENAWKGPRGEGWNSQQDSAGHNPGQPDSWGQSSPHTGRAEGQNTQGAGSGQPGNGPVYQPAPPVYGNGSSGSQNNQGSQNSQNTQNNQGSQNSQNTQNNQGGQYSQNGRQGGNCQYQTQYQTPPPPDKNNMSTASLVMGILSLVSCCCTWIGIVFGVLGIIFALMSKADGQMDGQAKTGLVLSIVGIVLDILIIILFVALQVFSMLPNLGIFN